MGGLSACGMIDIATSKSTTKIVTMQGREIHGLNHSSPTTPIFGSARIRQGGGVSQHLEAAVASTIWVGSCGPVSVDRTATVNDPLSVASTRVEVDNVVTKRNCLFSKCSALLAKYAHF